MGRVFIVPVSHALHIGLAREDPHIAHQHIVNGGRRQGSSIGDHAQLHAIGPAHRNIRKGCGPGFRGRTKRHPIADSLLHPHHPGFEASGSRRRTRERHVGRAVVVTLDNLMVGQATGNFEGH